MLIGIRVNQRNRKFAAPIFNDGALLGGEPFPDFLRGLPCHKITRLHSETLAPGRVSLPLLGRRRA